MLETKTIEAMEALSNFARKGGGDHPPGVVSERMEVYRRLIQGGLSDTLERAYPVAQTVLEEEQWDELVTTFIAEHPVHTPYLWQVPREFQFFVKAGRYGEQWQKPYLDDLMQFEWLEIGVHMMPDGELPQTRPGGDVMRDRVVLNPDHSLDVLSYPVFSGRPEQWREKKGTYFLLTYRDRFAHTVHYSHLSPPCAIAVELLRQQPLCGQQIADFLAQQQGQPKEVAEQTCGIFLRECLIQKIAIGFLVE